MPKTKEELELDAENERQAKAAKIRAEGEEKELDETVPGGRFEVDGKMVNSEGKPLKGSKSSSGGEDLENLTVAELRDRARDAEVSGFSTMTKDELIKAVKKAEK